MRWKYDFNASGCWIVDEEGFTVVGHMPITVEQCQVIVMEHNAMLDRIAGNEALAKHIVVFRPNGKLNCETQYFGPFTFDDAYEYLDTKLPAIGICPEGENAGVKFIQELVRAA